MKLSLRSSLLGVVTLILLTVVTVHAQQNGPSAQKAIAALENQWLKSQQTNNPDLAFWRHDYRKRRGQIRGDGCFR